MENKYENGILTVKLVVRIDSHNASAVEKDLISLVEGIGAKEVILDAKKTEYISSAGLRIIPKLKRTVENSKIINASSAVYEVLDMTGFTDIIEVEKAMEK